MTGPDEEKNKLSITLRVSQHPGYQPETSTSKEIGFSVLLLDKSEADKWMELGSILVRN